MTELVAGRYIQLTATIGRLIAPNAGIMTGPGTNTYLVGDATGIAVIDPGPADAAHVDALCEAAPGPIEKILVTHTHRDHSPGANLLQRLCGAETFGMHPPDTPENDRHFAPDRVLGDTDTLAIGDVTLQAVHTPGHASNHLCYLLVDDRLLFTGDHLMNGSTVVIAPPDGSMRAYLASLEKLKPLRLSTIAPGHGDLIRTPDAVIDWTIDHRREREAKVVDALRRVAPAPIESLIPIVYGDVDERLHSIAKYSLWAHLEKLAEDGIAVKREHDWVLAERAANGSLE